MKAIAVVSVLLFILLIMFVIGAFLYFNQSDINDLLYAVEHASGGLVHQQQFTGLQYYVIQYYDVQSMPDYGTVLAVINGSAGSNYGLYGNQTAANETVKGGQPVYAHIKIPFTYGPDYFLRVTDVFTLARAPDGGFEQKPGNYSVAFYTTSRGGKTYSYPTFQNISLAQKYNLTIYAIYNITIITANDTYTGPLRIAVDACYRDPYSPPAC